MTLASRNKFVIQKVLESDITEEDKIFFQLWNEKPLLSLKSDFLAIIEQLRKEQYQQILENLEEISEFKIQKTEYISRAAEQFEKYTIKTSSLLQVAAKQGMDYQAVLNSKSGLSTELNTTAIKNRANLHAGELITGINETTRVRINKLITKALDEGMSKYELKEILKTDFGFSEYRANLIARNELKRAYIQGQKIQFAQRQKESWMRGYKDWISHRDDRVTELCFLNDMAWTIPFDDIFPSEDMEPPRFPWCRCSIAYFPYSEAELWEVDDIPEYHELFEEMKPENYDELSSKIVPKSFFEGLGKKLIYIQEEGDPFFDGSTNKLSVGTADGMKKKYAEVHELWHAFYELRIAKNREWLHKYIEIQDLIKAEIAELQEAIAKYFPQGSHNALEVFQIEEIFKEKTYLVLEKHQEAWGKVILTPKYSERYKWDYHVAADLIGAITRGELGGGHLVEYYKEKGYDEVMPAINTIHFFNNKILEVLLPKSYTAIKSFYSDLWIEF